MHGAHLTFHSDYSSQKTILLGPTYSEYERDLRINGSDISYYFLKEKDDFKINSDEFISAITADTDLVIICNPNNPTGSLITPDKLKTILTHCKDTNTYVMIDETYIEFVPDVDELSAIPLTELFDNVIILRGTSKFLPLRDFVWAMPSHQIHKFLQT